MRESWAKLLASSAPKATLLVRLVIGWVFLSEGIQKFLFPAALGVGRFVKIGIPWPSVLAPFVGGVEIVFGLLVIVGLLTRLASIPLLVVSTVAIASTKIPMLLKSGFWSAMHEARVDLSMFFCLVFLIASGAGPISMDAKIDAQKAGGA